VYKVTYEETVWEASNCWTFCISITFDATHTCAVDDSGHQ